jgi:hypothetical protein
VILQFVSGSLAETVQSERRIRQFLDGYGWLEQKG